MNYIKTLLATLALFVTFTSAAMAATQVEFETSVGNFVVEVYPEKHQSQSRIFLNT